MMRGMIIASLAIPAIAAAQSKSCMTPGPKAAWVIAQRAELVEKPGSWSNDSLRKAIVDAADISGEKLDVQKGWQLYGMYRAPKNRDAIEALNKLGAVRGSTWPLRSVVGAAGVRAMFNLSQADSALRVVSLHRMMEGGQGEGLKADIAILEDQLRLHAGRKQLYGTQLQLDGHNVSVMPIEDSAHVDLRRDGANLPPLAWSVCNAKANLAK